MSHNNQVQLYSGMVSMLSSLKHGKLKLRELAASPQAASYADERSDLNDRAVVWLDTTAE